MDSSQVVDLTFDEQYHAYWWGDTYVPSVTQILDANGFTSDFCKSQTHADRGTDIHEMVNLEIIRLMDKRHHGKKSKERLNYLIETYPDEWKQFLNFMVDYDLRFIVAERMIHGSLSMFDGSPGGNAPDWAGKLDFVAIGRKNNVVYCVDVKTGVQPPPHARLQTAAYTMALYPIGYEEVVRLALKLNYKRKNYGTKPYPNTGDFTEWLHEVRRFQRNNPR